MDNVSRPLIALLVGTVVLFAVYFVALRPSGSSSSSASNTQTAASQGLNPQSVSGFKSDISAARNAVSTANAAAAAQGGQSAPSSSAAAAPAATRTSTAQPRTGATSSTASGAARHRLDLVSRALDAHRVVALLFYNPAATDDRAVKRELAAVPTHHGRVMELAVPIAELARYPVVSQPVPVTQSPTLVLIDGARQASTIVGFTDRFEIAQRVLDALSVR